jgi:DNA-binding MarR family transcriptional regulator
VSNKKLGPTQRVVMMALDHREHQRARATEIAEHIGGQLTPNAVACALHRLEARGLVRTVDAHRQGAAAIWTRT